MEYRIFTVCCLKLHESLATRLDQCPIRYIGMIGFIGPFVALYFWSVSVEGSSTLPYLLCAILAYTGVCILDRSYQKDGNKWNTFQRLEIWSYFTQYFRAGITTESSLDSDQQYIFCSFPHGACKKLRQKHLCFFRACWNLTYLFCTIFPYTIISQK